MYKFEKKNYLALKNIFTKKKIELIFKKNVKCIFGLSTNLKE